jgi:hypothetical protein
MSARAPPLHPGRNVPSLHPRSWREPAADLVSVADLQFSANQNGKADVRNRKNLRRSAYDAVFSQPS